MAGPAGESYGLADIHIHSSVSDGVVDIPRILEYVEQKTTLDVIAVTDHDEIRGAFQARELVAKSGYRFEVVVGMEVTTVEGHLLVLFLEKPVPSYQPMASTIEAAHAEGGLCIVPHPLRRLNNCIDQATLDRVWDSLDGIEMVNPSVPDYLRLAGIEQTDRERRPLAELGGSDAHIPTQIGYGYTVFQGRSAANLRQSLLNKTTRAGWQRKGKAEVGPEA